MEQEEAFALKELKEAPSYLQSTEERKLTDKKKELDGMKASVKRAREALEAECEPDELAAIKLWEESAASSPSPLTASMADLKEGFERADYDENTVYVGDNDELIATPLRSRVHVHLLELEDRLKDHPWAQFIYWFCTVHPLTKEAENSIFTEDQKLERAAYSVQFVYATSKPYVLLEEKGKLTALYALYNDGDDDELNRLKEKVKQLEA